MSNTIRFLLDGEVVEITDADPTDTVLNWLRYRIARTGTKEGCAEGDCGACTVVLGELKSGRVHYAAVNACILFLPVLDGKELLTVESIKQDDGSLHPVQQALVDTHGSQCGFCTPGIVMSLYAHWLMASPTDKASIENALAGNLCRCTGYGPVIEAAQAMGGASEEIRHQSAATLHAIQRSDTLSLSSTSRLTGAIKKYFAPVTIESLADLLRVNPEATILAGGTDVGLWVTKQHRELVTVIYLGDVAELKFIKETSDAIEIGAGATYTDAITVLGAHYPDMEELIRRIGSVQIRNSGTIGGNIANGSPIGDSMPALIAAGSTLVLRKGEIQQTMPLEDYFVDYGKQNLAPGEFVVKVVLPKPRSNQHFRAYKLSKRFDQDISAVCACFGFVLEEGSIAEARICYGGMAATPKRAKATEAALVGKPWSEETIRFALTSMAMDYTPLTDMRASADYRMASAKNLLLKAFFEIDAAESIRVLDHREVAHG